MKWLEDIENYTGEPLDRLVVVAEKVMTQLTPLVDQYNNLECQRIVRLGDLAAQLVASKVPESIIRDLVFPKTDEAALVALLVKYLPLLYQEVFPEELEDLAVTVDCDGKDVVVHVREDATIRDLLETMRELPALENLDLSAAWIIDGAGKRYPTDLRITCLDPSAKFVLTY